MKNIRISIENEDRFMALALSLIRAARLEFLNAPLRILNREYLKISERIILIQTPDDASRLVESIEQILLRNISLSQSNTSCLNCAEFLECPDLPDTIDHDEDDVPPCPYLFEDNAMSLCKSYRPDWNKFDEAAKVYPEVMIGLRATLGVEIDRKYLARKLLDVMNKSTAGVMH